RKPLYYEINLIMPCIAILIVALFGFRLPPESGERISLSVTVLLALSVFLQLASEHTPTQSDVVPLMSRYFMVAIGMSSLCVLGSILVLLLQSNGKQAKRMGHQTELFFTLLCRLICYPGFQEAGANASGCRGDGGTHGGNRHQNRVNRRSVGYRFS
uniref:Neur_chan_memb domain-containing protein n=1 Tax=Macrostomum lignano TaxID=282301 RepID=A0A1I8GII6_9PLAT